MGDWLTSAGFQQHPGRPSTTRWRNEEQLLRGYAGEHNDRSVNVDPKTMGMYLDTVKQVMGIYKHLDAGRGPEIRR